MGCWPIAQPTSSCIRAWDRQWRLENNNSLLKVRNNAIRCTSAITLENQYVNHILQDVFYWHYEDKGC